MSVVRGPLLLTLILAFVGTVLLFVALGSNNWTEVLVDRGKLNQTLSLGDDSILPDIYYSRSYGLFRECFIGQMTPTKIPGAGSMRDQVPYKDLMDYKCVHIFPGFKYVDGLNDEGKSYVDILVSMLSMYIVGLAFCVAGVVIMIVGTGSKKAIPVLITGFLLLLGSLFIASAVALWHKSQQVLKDIPSVLTSGDINLYNPQKQPKDVASASSQTLGWTYIVVWVGIGLCILSSLTACLLTYAVTSDKSAKTRRAHQLLSQFSASTPEKSILGSSSQPSTTPSQDRMASGKFAQPPLSTLSTGGYTVSSLGEFYPSEHNSTVSAATLHRGPAGRALPYYGYAANPTYPAYYSYDDIYGFVGYYNPYVGLQ